MSETGNVSPAQVGRKADWAQAPVEGGEQITDVLETSEQSQGQAG
jgi:hypothetical protein